MGLNFTMIMCVVAILICSLALVLNLVAGNFLLALIMIFCIIVNTSNLIKTYNKSIEQKRY